jgi:transposase
MGRRKKLTLDRSEWQKGKKWVQVLLVGIAGISIPLLWQTFHTRGPAPKVTRDALLKCFQKWMQVRAEQQVYWTADREFASKNWFEALSKMHFCIRLKKNVWVKSGRNKLCKLYQLFENGQRMRYKKPLLIQDTLLYVQGRKLANGDYFIVGSATKELDLTAIYGKRWQIETLFGAFKSRGFDLEGCGLVHKQRVKTLLFVLSLALVWAIRTGVWLEERGKKIPLKRFKDQSQRRWKSVFRWGLEYLQNIIIHQLDYQDVIKLCPV